MASVKLKDGDSYPDGFVKKFKRAVEKSGVLSELKKRQYYIKKSKLKQRAKAAAVKRWKKKNSRDMSSPKERR